MKPAKWKQLIALLLFAALALDAAACGETPAATTSAAPAPRGRWLGLCVL